MQIFFVLCYDSKILSDVFWCARKKEKKNEISFLHFIVFLKEENKKEKKQINISQALKY